MESTVTLSARAHGATRENSPRYTREEWEFIKPIIYQLYLEEDETLPNVIDILNEVYRFTPS
jgi:hypothetical protein